MMTIKTITTLTYGEKGDPKITNLRDFLKKQTADRIIIRTTWCKGGWHDNEFDAERAGFKICRIQNPEWEARHEFAEAYLLTREF